MLHCFRLAATAFRLTTIDEVPKGGAPDAWIIASPLRVADSSGLADSVRLADPRPLSGPAGIPRGACVIHQAQDGQRKTVKLINQ